jgi:hypothetical protein
MCRVGAETGRAKAVNISGGGIFVSLDALPSVGDEVLMSFVLPGSKQTAGIKAVGEVRRVVSADAGPQKGFGAIFIGVQPESRAAIMRFVEEVAVRCLKEAEKTEPEKEDGAVVEIKMED